MKLISTHALGMAFASAVVVTCTPALADPTFSIISSPNPSASGNVVNALAALNPNDVWAVGFNNSNNLNDSRTLIQHWNGRSWSTVRSPNPGSPASCSRFNSGNVLNAAAAVSRSDVWAVGFSFSCSALLKPMILNWNGRHWSVVPNPALNVNDNAALNGVVALASDNIYAVGYQPAPNGAVLTLIEHWDGTSWSVVASPNPSPTGNTLSAVAATPSGELWAVGDTVDQATTSIQTLTLHSTDGVNWSVVTSPNPLPPAFLNQNVLAAVTAPSPNDVTAAGFILDFSNQRRLTLVEHWDGSSWQVVTSANPSSAPGSLNVLTAVTSQSGKTYAAGYQANAATNGNFLALIEQFDGAAWSIVGSPAVGVAQQLFDIEAVPGSSQLWGSGAYSTNDTDTESNLLIVPKTLSIFAPSG